jgi:hypothetical protein
MNKQAAWVGLLVGFLVGLPLGVIAVILWMLYGLGHM